MSQGVQEVHRAAAQYRGMVAAYSAERHTEGSPRDRAHQIAARLPGEHTDSAAAAGTVAARSPADDKADTAAVADSDMDSSIAACLRSAAAIADASAADGSPGAAQKSAARDGNCSGAGRQRRAGAGTARR